MSGRLLSDIHERYTAGCQLYANGVGACNHQWAGYFYDGLWLIASILHAYLVEQNKSISDLGTDYSREALYNLSLQQDFMGLTGRVRQFNAIEPVANPPSHGDREGIILLRQVTGSAEDAFTVLAHRSAGGLHFLSDIRWNQMNSSQSVPCAAGVCDLQAGWVPADQDSRCPPGTVWDNELGCTDCPAGTFGHPSATACSPCPLGSFSSAPGMPRCEACPEGTSGIIEGLARCIDCPLGYFMNRTGAVECRKCPRDTYGDRRGLSSCIRCPEGKSVEYEGATLPSMCTCKGWLWLGHCLICPYGTRFDQGSCVQCAMDEICEDGRVVGHLPSKKEWEESIHSAGLLLELSQSLPKQLLFVAAGVRAEENRAKLHQDVARFSWTLEADVLALSLNINKALDLPHNGRFGCRLCTFRQAVHSSACCNKFQTVCKHGMALAMSDMSNKLASLSFFPMQGKCTTSRATAPPPPPPPPTTTAAAAATTQQTTTTDAVLVSLVSP